MEITKTNNEEWSVQVTLTIPKSLRELLAKQTTGLDALKIIRLAYPFLSLGEAHRLEQTIAGAEHDEKRRTEGVNLGDILADALNRRPPVTLSNTKD